jgi:hypothetical protein
MRTNNIMDILARTHYLITEMTLDRDDVIKLAYVIDGMNRNISTH